jgi:oligopeptide transport system substrate-binding protein
MKLRILITLLCLFFLGCHSSSASKSLSILRVSFPEDPATLDPRKGGDPISANVKFMLFEGLTRMTPSSTSEFALAKDVSISEDKRIYTFYLHKTYWSNGESVTAHDFAYAWKTLLEPDFPSPDASLLYPIKNAKAAKVGDVPNDAIGVRALDDMTLEVELETPTPYFLNLTSFCIYFPVPHDKDFTQEVYNGPFKMKKYCPNNLMILEKNPLYWDAEHVKIDGVEITFVEDEITALNLYTKQELDFLGARFSPIPLDSIPRLREEGILQTMPLGATSFCTFNVTTTPFSNANIRKAFAYAMDREAIVSHITQMNEEVAFDPIPPLLKENRVDGLFLKQDLSKAQDYLKLGLEELGLTKNDLQDIPFVYLIDDTQSKVVQALQHQWMDTLGIRVKLEGYTFKVYLDKLMKRDYQLGYALWIIQYPDLMNIFDRFKFKSNVKNYPGWENSRYIDILNTSTTFSSLSKRTYHLKKAEEILIDEMPIAPIYHWKEAFLQQPYVSGIYISPIGSVHLGFAEINKDKIHED